MSRARAIAIRTFIGVLTASLLCLYYANAYKIIHSIASGPTYTGENPNGSTIVVKKKTKSTEPTEGKKRKVGKKPKSVLPSGGMAPITLGFTAVLTGYFLLPGLLVWLACRIARKIRMLPKPSGRSITGADSEFSSRATGGSDHAQKKSKAIAWIKEGQALFRDGQYSLAIHAFTCAMNLYPCDVVYYNRGVVHYRENNHYQFIKDLKCAARLGHRKSQEILTALDIAWQQ